MKKPIFVPCRTGYRVPHPLCRSLIVLIAGVFLTGVYFQAFTLVLRFWSVSATSATACKLPPRMKKKVLKIAKLLLVMLFVSYYCESSLFYHTHYFSWGVVTHSHPYLPAGSGTPGHNHTPVQCDTIAQLSMLLFVAGISLVSFFVPGVEVRFRPPVRHGRESSSVPLPQLRAPPALV